MKLEHTILKHIAIYKCYNRSQHKQNCNSPSTYRAEKVDAVVDQLIHDIFSRAKDVNAREFIKKQVASTSAQYQRQLKKTKADHGKAVTMSRGYNIQIGLNISKAQYFNGMEMM